MNTKHILVVDDESAATRNLKIHVESTGSFDVAIEFRAVLALGTARRIWPGLILIDVVVSGMDGGDIATKAA